MPKNSIPGYATLILLVLLLIGSSILYAHSPIVETAVRAVKAVLEQKKEPAVPPYPYTGEHVVVFLDNMQVELRNGTTTLETLAIISIGKPGSYYETIGGTYENDYKIRNHFSSLGKVYLPYAVHVFGNFFIHGIPYYPDGKKVSSTYSGGCIRLQDADAERIYDFVKNGTPIVIVKQGVEEFSPTATTTDTYSSMETTRYMATLVSLEVLKQDEKIQNDDDTSTTRRKLIPRLLNEKDDAVIEQIAKSVGSETFLDYMNKKAVSLGLSNTVFSEIDRPATTSAEDHARLVQYVADYKSYLVGVASTTPLLSR